MAKKRSTRSSQQEASPETLAKELTTLQIEHRLGKLTDTTQIHKKRRELARLKQKRHQETMLTDILKE